MNDSDKITKKKIFKNNMKTIGTIVVGGIVILIVMFTLIFGMRKFSEATVARKVFSPADGVQCVQLITADGCAIDCWKVEKN